MITDVRLADYHVHTPYCGHAQGKIVEYIESACAAGVAELGFSDHLGRYYLSTSQKHRYSDWGMEPRNIGRYMAEIIDDADAYADRIAVRSGLEVDYIAGAEDLLNSIVSLYPLDYLLGSIHCLPSLGWEHLAHYARKDPWPLFESYFEAAQAAIRSRVFDSLAHIDFIWRYLAWPDEHTEKAFHLIDDTIKTAAQADVAIEINSNGYLWSEIYHLDGGDPFDVLLESVKRHAAHITLGSDAHKPEYVAKAFGGVRAALKRKEIRHYCTFAGRKRLSIALD